MLTLNTTANMMMMMTTMNHRSSSSSCSTSSQSCNYYSYSQSLRRERNRHTRPTRTTFNNLKIRSSPSSSNEKTCSTYIDNNNNNNNNNNNMVKDRLALSALISASIGFLQLSTPLLLSSPVYAYTDVTNEITLNGPAKYLPNNLTKPDPIFEKDFTVKFAGFEVDHKILVGTIIVGQTIGFAGAIVGGLEAKSRAQEITRLNKSLLEVNDRIKQELRREKKKQDGINVNMSIDSDGDPYVEKILMLLRTGKAMLKSESTKEKLIECERKFEEALTLIVAESGKKKLTVPWKAERKALKGIGAVAVRLGYTGKALDMYKKVLNLALENKDMAEITDNYGKIADLYTELDQLESAQKYYDLYFSALDNEYGFSA
jgi:tetratricopeptide (TPR) repeat protein